MLVERINLLARVQDEINKFQFCETRESLDAVRDSAAKMLANGYLDDVIGNKTYDLWYHRIDKYYIAFGFCLLNGGKN